jgi:hypothetical protein
VSERRPPRCVFFAESSAAGEAGAGGYSIAARKRSAQAPALQLWRLRTQGVDRTPMIGQIRVGRWRHGNHGPREPCRDRPLHCSSPYAWIAWCTPIVPDRAVAACREECSRKALPTWSAHYRRPEDAPAMGPFRCSSPRQRCTRLPPTVTERAPRAVLERVARAPSGLNEAVLLRWRVSHRPGVQ